MKQYFFSGVMPFLAIVIIICWRLLYYCGKNRFFKTWTKNKLNDYTILSLVLMSFLFYPMLTRLALSMLKCPWVGGKMWLMADLQEPCFEGRHLNYVITLTIPQLLLYVIGLPLTAVVIIIRNSHRLLDKRFYTRYGLLYLGYRDERAWWEGIIAIRKVAIVSISTFGTLLGVVDLQIHLCLLVVFLSIVAHLAVQPFDILRQNTRMLHNLEFTCLVVCFLTYWGGLFFFLGHEKVGTVNPSVLVFFSISLVLANFCLLMVSAFIFFREWMKDKKTASLRRESKRSEKKTLDAMQLEHVVSPSAKTTEESQRKEDDGSRTIEKGTPCIKLKDVHVKELFGLSKEQTAVQLCIHDSHVNIHVAGIGDQNCSNANELYKVIQV